jgi:hypothetical protein
LFDEAGSRVKPAYVTTTSRQTASHAARPGAEVEDTLTGLADTIASQSFKQSLWKPGSIFAIVLGGFAEVNYHTDNLD